MSFSAFIRLLQQSPYFLITILLLCGVILVNGSTDAPNTIATCVTTKAMTVSAAVRMAAVCNFLGVYVSVRLWGSVTDTIRNIVDFHGERAACLAALCAAMCAIIVWGIAAWYFGIPTSESHALTAGLSGASVGFHQDLSGIHKREWHLVLLGLVLSSVIAFVVSRELKRIPHRAKGRPETEEKKRLKERVSSKILVFFAAALAFLHGMQDGGKFAGVLFLIEDQFVYGGAFDAKASVWTAVGCSLLMSVGTMSGGKKILNRIGKELKPLSKEEGIRTDVASCISLAVCTLFGLPVSTTHTRTFAIIGSGEENGERVNKKSAEEMVSAWLLTFPACGLIGFGLARLFRLLPWF